MLKRLSKSKKNEFLLTTLAYLPVSFLLSVLILLYLARLFDVKLTLGGVVFVLSGIVLVCIGGVINYYRKLLKGK